MSAAERAASMSPEDLIAVIERGLKADEDLARWASESVGDGRWQQRNVRIVTVADDNREVADYAIAECIDHIARHDPSRVLADVESKREILAEHSRPKPLTWAPDDPSCPTCDEPWPCWMVRILARPYLAQETT